MLASVERNSIAPYSYWTGKNFIFKIRRMDPRGEQSAFRTPLYPILPGLFLLCSAAFIVYAVMATPHLTALGLAVIAAGIPLYFYFRKSL